MRSVVDRVVDEFLARYDRRPDVVVRSPGRVNLIGDHTDYNLGLAMPMAIPQALYLAASRRPDRTIRVASADHAPIKLSLDEGEARVGGWGDYVQGVARQMIGPEVLGWDGLVVSDLREGTGLSSSAALELATARTFASLNSLEWDPTEMARISSRAENEWVGLESGLLDQLACALGREGQAMVIDFASLEVRHVPLPSDIEVVIFDPSVSRSLVDSGYNTRRRECAEASVALGIDSLREVTPELLEMIDGTLLRRVRHVYNENVAVRSLAEALATEDLDSVGKILQASHKSLRDDYEASTPEIDLMVQTAVDAGALGARMTGGGFGGSVVAMFARGTIRLDEVLDEYERATGLVGTATTVVASDGTSVAATF